jgi:hypothetical protein
MRAAYRLLVGLTGISPVLLFVDRPMIHALLVAYAAVAVALVGAFIRPGEAGHLASIIRPVAIIAAIFAVWLLVQVTPLPVKSWAHPIWADAEAALGAPIAGSITIDPGATVVAICRYLSAMAILFVAAAVTIDRLRAEQVLFWLVGATTLAAVVHIIHGLFIFDFLDATNNAGISVSTTALSGIGLTITAAAVVRAIEHYEVRPAGVRFTNFAVQLSLPLVAFGICALSLIIFSKILVSVAAAAGLAALAVLVVTRRLGFGPWAGDTIAATAIGIVIVIAIVVAQKHTGTGDAVLRYASHSQSGLISTTERIIGDTGWAGSGAGTFNLLLPIYGDSSGGPAGMPAPTTAAQIAIELGQPALRAILIVTIIVLFMLLRGVLQRGRDSFYPAVGAGCIVVLTFEAFCDASLFSTTVQICAVVVLGLGLAQRAGRTVQ